MAATNRYVEKGGRHGFAGFDEGDQMPYRTPRGHVEGSRRGLHVAQVLAVLLVIVLFVAVAYMAGKQWG